MEERRYNLDLERMNKFNKQRRVKDKIKFHLDRFERSLDTLQDSIDVAVNVPEHLKEFLRDSVVKRFDYTYACCVTATKYVLEDKGVLLQFPKEIFQESFKAGWIKNVEVWSEIVDGRNTLSHTYNEGVSVEVFNAILEKYYVEMRLLLNNLKREASM